MSRWLLPRSLNRVGAFLLLFFLFQLFTSFLLLPPVTQRITSTGISQQSQQQQQQQYYTPAAQPQSQSSYSQAQAPYSPQTQYGQQGQYGQQSQYGQQAQYNQQGYTAPSPQQPSQQQFVSATPSFQVPSPTQWGQQQQGYSNFSNTTAQQFSQYRAPSPSSTPPTPSEVKSPEKQVNWNDPPNVQPKKKTTAQQAPIFAPVVTTNPVSTFVPPQQQQQQGGFSNSPANSRTSSAPPVDVGPPKGGFQRQETTQPVSNSILLPFLFQSSASFFFLYFFLSFLFPSQTQSFLPNPSLIPQPNIMQQTLQSPPQPVFSSGQVQQQQQQGDAFGRPQNFSPAPSTSSPAQPFQPPPAQYSAQPQQPTMQQPPKVAAPVKKKPVSGDRSKIPREHQPIVNGLGGALALVERNQASPSSCFHLSSLSCVC